MKPTGLNSCPTLYPLLMVIAMLMPAISTAYPFDSGLLEADQMIETARRISPDMYPDADSVLLGRAYEVIYEADATYEQWHEEYRVIFTEDARRRYLTLSSYFTIPYQRGPEDCSIPLLRIIKPDGRIQTFDVEQLSRVMINPASMQQNIYNPNEKILQVNVAGLEIGDILHFVFYDRIVKPRMEDTWSNWFLFESTEPILYQRIRIDGPANRPLASISLKDELPDTVTFTQEPSRGRMVYSWEAGNIPRMFPEPNMPPIHTVVQRLLVSTAPDWESISRWYWNLSEPRYGMTPAMKDAVHDITAGLESFDERLRALFTFVSQQIRYLGITVEHNAPGYEPHEVSDTFEQRHGVCRDKAALLVVMLREAGIEAFPTLIHSGHKKDPDVPLPWFNHAIVAAIGPQGQYILMDPTDENTAQLLPSYLNNKSYLVARPEGDTLRTSPIDPADVNLMRMETNAKLDTTGRIQAESVLHFDGINDNAYRGWFSRLKQEDRRRFFEGLVKIAATGAELTEFSLEPANMQDTGTPLVARIQYRADPILIEGRQTSFLPIPSMGNRVGIVNFVLGKTGLRERTYPLVTDIACGVEETITLTLPAELAATLQPAQYTPVQHEEILWQQTMTRENQRLIVQRDFRLNVVEFDPEQYRILKKSLQQIERESRKLPRIDRSLPAADDTQADAEILEFRVDYIIESPHAWQETLTTRKRILTYAGMKAHSELSFSFTPVWEDIHVATAAAILPDGTRREMRTEELNLMDQPWVGQAPRYPAGKTLVASIPGVEPGAEIEYRIIRHKQLRPFFAMQETFRTTDPLHRKTVVLDAPIDMSFTIEPASHPMVSFSIVTNDTATRIIRTWSATNMPALLQEDALPPWWEQKPTLFVSAGAWDSYAETLHWRLLQAADWEQAGAIVRPLLEGLEDPMQQLAAIRNEVVTRTKAAGPLFDQLPLGFISPAGDTMRDGYGNKSDRAVLLYSLLAAAGLNPQFIAASWAPPVPELQQPLLAAPAPGTFNRLLVRVPAPAGSDQRQWIYVNNTDQYAAIDTSAYESRLGLALPNGSVETIEPGRTNQEHVHYRIRLADDGDATLRKTQQFHGSLYGLQHRRFSEMTPELRRREHQEMVAAIAQAAIADSELITDFSAYPGLVDFSVHIPGYAVRDGKFLYASLPNPVQHVLRLREDNRRQPLFLDNKRTLTWTTEVDIPDGFSLEYLPVAQHRENVGESGVSVWLSSQMIPAANGKGARILISGRMEQQPAIVPAHRYKPLRELDSALGHPRNGMIVLKATAPHHQIDE